VILKRFAGFLLALIVALSALIWASIVLALAAAIALLLGAWLWWHGRKIERDHPAPEVIEGEYRVEIETRRLEARPPER